MSHHGRGISYANRVHLAYPRRDEIKLLNRKGEELAVIQDAPWSSVSMQDSNAVVNLQNESRTWRLPVIECGEYRPVTGYQIRSLTDDSLWEILSVPRIATSMYQCVCVRMNEHNGLVP